MEGKSLFVLGVFLLIILALIWFFNVGISLKWKLLFTLGAIVGVGAKMAGLNIRDKRYSG